MTTQQIFASECQRKFGGKHHGIAYESPVDEKTFRLYRVDGVERFPDHKGDQKDATDHEHRYQRGCRERECQLTASILFFANASPLTVLPSTLCAGVQGDRQQNQGEADAK